MLARQMPPVNTSKASRRVSPHPRRCASPNHRVPMMTRANTPPVSNAPFCWPQARPAHSTAPTTASRASTSAIKANPGRCGAAAVGAGSAWGRRGRGHSVGMLKMPLPRSKPGPPRRAGSPVLGLVALRSWWGMQAADGIGSGAAKVAAQFNIDPMYDRRDQHGRDQRSRCGRQRMPGAVGFVLHLSYQAQPGQARGLLLSSD